MNGANILNTTKKWLLFGCILFIIFTFSSPVQPRQPTIVNVWLTTGDQKHLLSPQTSLAFTTDTENHLPAIDVNPTIRYQTMDGFGAAITGSSAYLINQKMSTVQRESLVKELFSKKSGININFIRHTIGASDFSVDEYGQPSSYTYDDTELEKDYDLKEFSIKKDAQVIKLLQKILNNRSNVKVIGTPWTAPSWMKYGTKTLNGWYLDYTDEKVYASYANYFVKYIKAYKNAGIPIYAVTVQNEPEFTTNSYPSMSMNAAEQAKFVGEYLGPAFVTHNISTKIIAYDHNWDKGIDYATMVLSDNRASAYTDGTAFHCYEGPPDSMTLVHNAFPNKSIYFTECSGGNWGSDFRDNFTWYMSNLMIGAPKNWSKTVLFWNLALDSSGGPANGGCSNCRGVITINPKNGSFSKNVEYYALGHVSKFVDAGAVRIDSTDYKGNIHSVAYMNSDGSIALIVANVSNDLMRFKIRWNSKSFIYTLPSKSASTFKWSSNSGKK
ncbi:glycoside hydrolase family 30 protein [Neobacillus sp. Marseille-QA0830]